MPLSPQQDAAVQRSGQDVCCVAGPGSGKTTVLVERFVSLVTDVGLDPQRILAITFTEKAANNIKDRLVRRFTELKRADLLPHVQRAPISTIHAFCTSLLHEYAIDAALDPDSRILDEVEAQTERSTAINAVLNRFAEQRPSTLQSLYETWATHNPTGHLLAVHDAIRIAGGMPTLAPPQIPPVAPLIDQIAAAVQDAVSRLPLTTATRVARRESLLEWLGRRPRISDLDWLAAFNFDRRGLGDATASELIKQVKEELIPQARATIAAALNAEQYVTLCDILRDFDAEYAAAKRRLGAVDFTDLEERSLALLTGNATVSAEIRQRYQSILMDELQDTNPIQWKIVNAIRTEGKFFAVGDVNQSIYGFRHAAPGLFSDYRERLEASGAAIDRLETNYRSRPEILNAVNTVAAASSGVTPHTLQPKDGDFPAKPQPSVELQVCIKPAGEDSYEHVWLIHRLLELRTELNLAWSDVAVLSRSAAPLARLESVLLSAGIPYLLAGGGNYFDRQEVIDLTNWLRVLDTTVDEIALYGLLRSPFFGHSDEEMFALHAQGQWPPAASMSIIEDVRSRREESGVAALLALAVDECGYLRGSDESVRSNVDKFLRLVRAFETRLPGDIAAWIEEMAMLRASSREANAATVEIDDAVQLLTIHKAKGLEFKLVALIGMERGTSPENSPLSWTEANSLGASWILPGEAKSTPDILNNANRDIARQSSADEEHRLLYVAMTRAEQHLLLSASKREEQKALSGWANLATEALKLTLGEPDSPEITDGVRVIIRRGSPGPLTAGNGTAARDAIELDRLAIEPQPSPAISATALVHFDECPRRSLLERVLRWPGDNTTLSGSGNAMDRGTRLHELLAAEDGEPAPPDASPELQELKRRFELSPLGQRMRAARRSAREYDFLVSIDGTLLRGSIDLWFEEQDGSVVVVDYKTGLTLRPELQSAYEAQVRLYAVALERLIGRLPDQAYLALLDRGEVLEVPLGEETYAHSREVLRTWREAETAGKFEMKPGRRCEFCPFFRGACESGWDPGPAQN